MTTTWLRLQKSSGSVVQAVYDNNEALPEKILEDYEMKLHMYSDYIVHIGSFDPDFRTLSENLF